MVLCVIKIKKKSFATYLPVVIEYTISIEFHSIQFEAGVIVEHSKSFSEKKKAKKLSLSAPKNSYDCSYVITANTFIFCKQATPNDCSAIMFRSVLE